MIFKFMTSTVRVIIGIIFMITIYLLPTGVALIRRHNNFIPIVLVNFFLGWTVLGWFVSLVWSFTSNVKEKRSIIELIKALKDGKLDG